MGSASAQLDVLIFGGGAAGLWLLDELCHRGFSALLVEREALGEGQTVASQGIIHGGIKYTLSGSLTPSARAIREMPRIWRECLEGRRRPTLERTRVAAQCCHLWRTESLKSRLGMVGARIGLRSGVSRVDSGDRPAALCRIPGDVFRVDEQVIDVVSLLSDLGERHRKQLVCLPDDEGAVLSTVAPGRVTRVILRGRHQEKGVEIEPRYVILAAGAGNQLLRQRAGLPPTAMQRRPLHMVLAHGPLPDLFGHCVDGARTRVTVTTAHDATGTAVWQIGGQVAEDGVRLSATELIAHAKREMAAVLPGVDLTAAEWATYRVDRAEGKTATGLRPEGPTMYLEGNMVTAWPTKLALVPELVRLLADRLGSPSAGGCDAAALVADWRRPEVARPPWEVVREWQR